MKIKHLIKHLGKMPPNAQIFLWEGFNCELLPKIKVSKMRVSRVKYPGEKAGAWENNIPSFIPENKIQSKIAVCIQPINKGKKIEGLR
jgi:hypothetical protein